MPWQEVTPMSQRQEFIYLAQQEEANISRLCRYFQVSRKRAYKWLDRYRLEGEAGLAERSRRPGSCPGATPATVAEAVLAVLLGGQRPEVFAPQCIFFKKRARL